MPENRLAAETSPYLLQHAADPVDWYPFGDEAFDRARELERPVFLSIGYSSCHWCHVMAHESFADEATAAQMNETVVSVKVDREERPDVDSIYMEAVQAATGGGGWPMSVFTTAEGKPFFAGTYFPDRPRHGSPSFRQVLAAVSDAWATRRDDVLAQADSLAAAVARRQRLSVTAVRPERAARAGQAVVPGRELVANAVARAASHLVELADPAHGGFGTAPKFPQPLFLDLLLRAHVSGMAGDLDPAPVDVVVDALESMASGGIWDHLGGGFARYSVDREWLVPHFEKMLYDQALIGRVYLHAWQCTGDIRWRQVLSELMAYVLRDLSLDGGIASSEDADSEGEEGRFYLWTRDELDEFLGATLAKTASFWWGVTDRGNFEGRNVLHRPVRGDLIRPGELEEARRRLFDARAKRERPGRDAKVLAEWNAMMCSTLAEAALVLGEPAWEAAAVAIAETLDTELRRPDDGRVLRVRPLSSSGAGREILGFAADVACMIDAFTRVGQLTGEARWFDKAVELAEQLLDLFEDDEEGGLFTTGSDAPSLVVRPKEMTDNVTPAAGSTAAVALARLAAVSGREDLFAAAERLVSAGALLLHRAPTAAPELLRAAELTGYGTIDVAVTGDRADLVDAVASRFEPRIVLAWQRPGGSPSPADERGQPPASGRHAEPAEAAEPIPLLRDRPAGAAYVCRFGECRLPARSVEELQREIDAALSV